MRLGTIGTNWITDQFIKAVNEIEGIELTAVYSRSAQKAEEFAAKHEAALHFTSLQEMAASDAIDCVYIASPNSLHFEQALLFLEHKKHVICEKPIFSNLQELEAAFHCAEQHGVFLFEAMKNIHVPNFTEVQDNLGKVGEIRSVLLHFNKYSSRYNNVLRGEEPNIFSLNFSGGALVDLGVYPVALAVSLFGKPDHVAYSPVLIPTGADGSGTLVLNYDSFVCTILCSKITTSYVNSEIQGEHGTISIGNAGTMANAAFIDIHTGERTELGTEQPGENMKYEVESFVRIVRDNNRAEYERLKQISRNVLAITETARKQNGIVYASEK